MIYQREILSQITPFLKHEITILLLGARQVGKTFIMELLRQEILNSNLAAPDQIISFDLESSDDLMALESRNADEFASYLYTRANVKPPEPLYVFVDEIQYLSNPSPFFKLLADHHPTLHLILSGSSSLEIKKIFTDRLTGRKVAFNILPLSFKEYLLFNDFPYLHLFKGLNFKDLSQGNTAAAEPLKNFVRDIAPFYEDFVVFGSYPRPSLLEYKPQREYLLKEIRDTYLRKDVSDILKIENVVGFNKLLALLAGQIGNLANIHEITAASGLDRGTVERYIFLIQETFIMSLARPFFNNPRQELVKMPKVFFGDTGLRNILLNLLQPLAARPDKGALVENAVHNQLKRFDSEPQFWRTKSKVETDFVLRLPGGGLLPIEVKYSSFSQPVIPRGLSAFIERYKPSLAYVATKDFFGKIKSGDTVIHFLPAFCF